MNYFTKTLHLFAFILLIAGPATAQQSNVFNVTGHAGAGTTSPNAVLEVQRPNILGGDIPFLVTAKGKGSALDTYFKIDNDGLVGVATASPEYLVDVQGSTKEGAFRVSTEACAGGGAMLSRLVVKECGKVGVGIDSIPSAYLMAINGKLICEEVRVELQSNWPDYVFQPGYQLRSLSDLEAEIKNLGHLPGMPSAEDVKENGITVGEMQTRMMEKIEELTLYVIELEKEISNLKGE